jgi:hypothetical protein
MQLLRPRLHAPALREGVQRSSVKSHSILVGRRDYVRFQMNSFSILGYISLPVCSAHREVFSPHSGTLKSRPHPVNSDAAGNRTSGYPKFKGHPPEVCRAKPKHPRRKNSFPPTASPISYVDKAQTRETLVKVSLCSVGMTECNHSPNRIFRGMSLPLRTEQIDSFTT